MIAVFSEVSHTKLEGVSYTKLEGYALRKARSDGYTRVAKLKFLEGTRCQSPSEAIELGIKTTQEWCDVLEQVREEFRINSHLYGN